MNLLARLFGKPSQHTAAMRDPALRLSLPEMPAALYAVGDIHGCCALYQQLEKDILADGAQFSGSKLIVVLGDIVDRGPDSAGVIDHLLAPLPDGWQRLVLRGNHEAMMLKFLAAPHKNKRWLEFGGRETLQSYGLTSDSDHGFNLPEARLFQKFEAAIPSAHIDFLSDLALCLEVGPFVFSHAGIDPAKPMPEQSPNDLMWGDPARIDSADTELMVVHGHTPVVKALISPRRVCVDTGAYASGILTAVRLLPSTATLDACRILTTPP